MSKGEHRDKKNKQVKKPSKKELEKQAAKLKK